MYTVFHETGHRSFGLYDEALIFAASLDCFWELHGEDGYLIAWGGV